MFSCIFKVIDIRSLVHAQTLLSIGPNLFDLFGIPNLCVYPHRVSMKPLWFEIPLWVCPGFHPAE
jgi:hypothetical protein